MGFDCADFFSSLFFKYNTPKVVLIRSRKIGLLNRFVQFAIVCYIVGYAIVYKKGYQEFDVIESAVTSKLKGVVFANTFADPTQKRIWDVADYVVPPQENGAFFVTTNVLVTPNQTQGVCPEDSHIQPSEGVICKTDEDCPNGTVVVNGNGVRTGQCVSESAGGVKTCEIHAWCPVEIDTGTPNPALLEGAKSFTVLIKNFIQFPKFGIKSRNILESSNKTYLTSCTYNADTDPFCPIFVLDTMLGYAGQDFNKMAIKGGVIGIEIHWDCNLDFSINDCKPVYNFKRLDDEEAKLAPGWNFRHADHMTDIQSGQLYRTLFKSYGIRFVTFVVGQGGKFSPLPLFLNIGSGLALLGIATVLCDVIVLYLLKKKAYYYEKKYLTVVDDDAFTMMEDDQLVNNKH